jgi:protein-S-isoprenylcysteine O-methyltransferase Ste14
MYGNLVTVTARQFRALARRRGWDMGFDLTVALVWMLFAMVCLDQFLNQGNYLDAGRFLFNTLIAWAFLRRRPAQRKGSLWENALAWGGTVLPIAGFHPALRGWPLIGLPIQWMALVAMIAALVSLGRSFGIAPADRGLVTTKLYRYVRHPLYTSELLFCVGYLIANLSWRNLLVFFGIITVQVIRLLREEKIITNYSSYSNLVRWRLIPHVW